MRGSSPCQKEQKGSSESSACALAAPEAPNPLAAAGGSYTRSISQSAHRVNPCRYSALHRGQTMAHGSLQQREKAGNQLRRTPPGGGATGGGVSQRKLLKNKEKPATPNLRLFGCLGRIQDSMSATISCLTASRP